MLDRTGQRLGNYILKSLVGQGGFADVYLGEHIYLETKAAIKVLQTRMTASELKEFIQEAKIIADLQHNHVVRVLDFGFDGNIPFLVMDYAPQGSLRHKHEKGTALSPTTIVPYVKQVAAALQYAHDQKLIHRDIKPENMLIGKRDDVLVSDFGLAVVARSTRSWEEQKIAGTAPYMSPEHFKGKAVPASDQYSLAVTVYEWLTGSPPFDEGDFMQLGYQHRFEAVPPLREKNPAITILPQLEQVVMKGLAKEPGQRFERIEAFAVALEQALRPKEPVIVTPPAPQKPAVVSKPIGTTLVTYRKHTFWVEAVHWSPDGIQVASSSSDGSVQVWNAMTGNQNRAYKTVGASAIAWSPDGKRFAAGGIDYKVHIWDAALQYEVIPYINHLDRIRALSWSPDGRYIVSGGGSIYESSNVKEPDFTLYIWNTTTGKCALIYKGHSMDVRAIQWSPNGKYIASGGNENVVQVWEATTGKRLYTYAKHANSIRTLAWSSDSRRVVSGSLDNTVQIWDALTGNNVLSYRGHGYSIEAIAWSPDGRQIASGGWDRTVQIWDATTGETIYTYKGHADSVQALSWSPDSKRIASGSRDKTVQVWQAR
ncbi:MAG TPA: serine/threonine-protein kinase [Ktedonobacteraceae bacterium]|nr:serine/threonine-protein kinase [Ktedonobacteraceae bacterium]